MISSISLALHLLAAVVWVGGMFFAYMALRPTAANQLEPPVRLTLWVGVFARFFPWVWISIILLLITGFGLISATYNSIGNSPLYVHLMLGIGIVMMLIYMHVFFAPYRRLKQAVADADWPTAGGKLAQIRILIAINTILGLITVAIAGGGRFMG